MCELVRMKAVFLVQVIGWRTSLTFGSRTLTTIPDAAKSTHLGGIPRRVILSTVGSIAKLYGTVFNSNQVHNKETLMSLVKSRPPGTPLVTVSNHVSTLDDPLMWGMRGLPLADPKLCRWTLAADDICFTNPAFSYFFRLGRQVHTYNKGSRNIPAPYG